jgi:hypothetical protein
MCSAVPSGWVASTGNGKKYSPSVADGVDAVGGGAGGKQEGVVWALETSTCGYGYARLG